MRLLPALLPLACASWLAAGGAQAADPDRSIASLATKAKFAGEIVVARGNAVIAQQAFGKITPDRVNAHWRWGTISKQLTAAIVLQEVAAGHIDIDAPVRRYYPFFRSPNAKIITIRQLLRHRSGLPNPDDTPVNALGVPAFYQPDWAMNATANGWCAGDMQFHPGERYLDNNCDYIVLGAVLQMVTGQSYDQLVASRFGEKMGMRSLGAFPTDIPIVPASSNAGATESGVNLAAYGAAGALYGTALDLLRFDRALMGGRLLDKSGMAELWRVTPSSGQIAMDQTVQQFPIKGCDKPVRVIEQRGTSIGMQGRNFILPDHDVVVIAFTNRAERDFAFGEAQQEKAFSHELLRAAACQ